MIKSKSVYLANRLEEVFLSGQWIANTNYMDSIQDITYVQAIQKHHDFNTIALLVFHINYYLEGILNVFEGGPLEIRDKHSFDMPPLRSSEEWQQVKNTFENNAINFIHAVRQMSDLQLNAPFVKSEYGTYERNIEGVIEHSYYHLGQISLLRKLI